MIPINLYLKVLIPGYRSRWRSKSSVLLDHMQKLVPQLTFGEADSALWIEVKGCRYRFYGFPSGEKEIIHSFLLGKYFPSAIPKEYFRLVKDYITRFMYPHMRPDLSPEGITQNNCAGFHGQHKENINDYKNGNPDKIREHFSPKRDDVIINGGSFIGFGDLHMSPLVADGKIYSIEADQECYSFLQKNLEVNNIKNVVPIHRGLWNSETIINLETGPAQANSLVSEVVQGESRQTVRTITIDMLIDKYDLSKVDMISITLNGAEVETLEGASETIARFKPRIRLPGWYKRSGIPIWQIAQEVLESKGYEVFVTPHGNVLAYFNK